MQDLKETLCKELDFINEGHNGERCAKELSTLPYVYVPRVAWDLTSKVANYIKPAVKAVLYFASLFFFSEF